MKLQARTDSPLRCSLCHGAIAGGGWTCPGCGTRVHTSCTDGASRCPTLGCTERVRLVMKARSSGWRVRLHHVLAVVHILLILIAWVVLSMILHTAQCWWTPWSIEPAPAWRCFVLVGMLLPAALAVSKFRRDVYS